MQIVLEETSRAIVARIDGEIDGKTAPEAQRTVLSALAEGSRLLLDLSGTTYMSSAGLRMLLLVHRESTSRSARLVLVGVRREVQEVMDATGFLRFFTLADTLDAGAELLG